MTPAELGAVRTRTPRSNELRLSTVCSLVVLFALAAAGLQAAERPLLLVYQQTLVVDGDLWMERSSSVFRSGLVAQVQTSNRGLFRSVLGMGDDASFMTLNEALAEGRIGFQKGSCSVADDPGLTEPKILPFEITTRWFGLDRESVFMAFHDDSVAADSCSAEQVAVVEAIRGYAAHVATLPTSHVVESVPAGSCSDPAPLGGENDPCAPDRYIVVFVTGTNPFEATASLASRYEFEPDLVFSVSFPGFAATLSDEVVGALRCEPVVLRVEHDACDVVPGS